MGCGQLWQLVQALLPSIPPWTDFHQVCLLLSMCVCLSVCLSVCACVFVRRVRVQGSQETE